MLSVEIEGGTIIQYLFGAGAGIYLFWRGFRRFRLKRLIEDTPTSKTRSLAVGPVEISGEAVPIFKIFAPFTQTPCAYYAWQVQEYRRSRRSGRWVTIAGGDSSEYPFFLEDDTGCVLINSQRAEVDIPWLQVYQSGLFKEFPAAARNFFEEKHIRYTNWLGAKDLRLMEFYIMPRQTVYVLGYAQPWKMQPASAGAKGLKNIYWRKELARLKRNREALAKYDLNQDGKVDTAEWEKARQEIARQVEETLSQQAQNMSVICQGSENSVFYISGESENELVKKLNLTCFFSILGGILLTAVCLGYILSSLWE